MIEIALAKLASLGLVAKIGAATGVVALSGTAAAATGALLATIQEGVAAVAEQVGIDIPGGTSAGLEATEATEVIEVPEVPEVPEVIEVEVPEVEVPDKPAAADFGTGVSDAARSGAPQEDGRRFGQDTSNAARETHQPAERPTAGIRPPAERPTAGNNPGTSYRPEVGAQPPAGTPGRGTNPGSARR
ncbi:MAG: hypothetical protein KY452_02830 [Actinobacteria bacterium]|nr:hypothetical protein [Actinomycetota bacterium]